MVFVMLDKEIALLKKQSSNPTNLAKNSSSPILFEQQPYMYVQIKRNLSYSKLMNLWIDSSSDKTKTKELFKHDVL